MADVLLEATCISEKHYSAYSLIYIHHRLLWYMHSNFSLEIYYKINFPNLKKSEQVSKQKHHK